VPEPALAFRSAGPADVDAVVALVESAYRGESSRAGWTTEADLLSGRRTDARQVTALLGRPDSRVILAEAAGVLVGCCHVERRAPEEARFGMFAVDPRRQGRGTGRALIREARLVAGSWGCRSLSMTVIRQRADLIAWYRSLEFLPTGEREPFPYGDERFGLPRRPDLEFVVLAGPVEA
jgi:GNAT superfamily N-acetyltransferase